MYSLQIFLDEWVLAILDVVVALGHSVTAGRLNLCMIFLDDVWQSAMG